MPTNNEVNHVTVESVSTDDAIEAIDTLFGHAAAHCEKVRPSGIREVSEAEVRQAKQALTRLWLERDALQEREFQLLALFAWARGWVPVNWDAVCRELFGLKRSTKEERIDLFLGLVEETTRQGRTIVDEADRKVKEEEKDE